jgi:hypothetical protein
MTTRTRDLVRGRTLRWSFDDGPAKGTAFEHEFREDGTVAYRGVDGSSRGDGAGKAAETAQYGSARLSDDVDVVSYRSANGYTLTVALNFSEGRMVAFASNSDQWFEQHGTFEVVA